MKTSNQVVKEHKNIMRIVPEDAEIYTIIKRTSAESISSKINSFNNSDEYRIATTNPKLEDDSHDYNNWIIEIWLTSEEATMLGLSLSCIVSISKGTSEEFLNSSKDYSKN